jgi:hypothetical protein
MSPITTETASKNTPVTPKTPKRISIFLTPFRSCGEGGEDAGVTISLSRSPYCRYIHSLVDRERFRKMVEVR